MHGYVLSYRPGTKSGAIVTDGGDVYAFDSPSPAPDLRGGDVVSFEADPSGGPNLRARDLRLEQRWAGRTDGRNRPLVGDLIRFLRPAASR